MRPGISVFHGSEARLSGVGLALLALALAGCATGGVARGAGARLDSSEPGATPGAAMLRLPEDARSRIVALASSLVGSKRILVRGRRFGSDCTGLVRAAGAELGVDLMKRGEPGENGVSAIWRFVQHHGRTFRGGRPLPGDLVFFRDTYDVDGDGRLGDGLSHVGIVEAVDERGTVSVIHRVSSGVARYRMNLERPDAARGADGSRLNDWLRAPGKSAPARLTAQLFAGYGTFLPLEPRTASTGSGAALAAGGQGINGPTRAAPQP